MELKRRSSLFFWLRNPSLVNFNPGNFMMLTSHYQSEMDRAVPESNKTGVFLINIERYLQDLTIVFWHCTNFCQYSLLGIKSQIPCFSCCTIDAIMPEENYGY